MSKISPVQATALGIKATKPASKPSAAKPVPVKTAASKPAPAKAAPMKVVAPKPAPAKVAAAKPVPTKAAATKSAPAKVVTKKPAAKAPAATKPTTTVKTVAKPAAKAKADSKAKPQKVKMERDSFTMPKEEYAQLAILKTRLATLGQPAKKSELLRAGIKLLVAMSDNTLKATLAKIPVIKTGRPKKK
jgi:hypothetical protein